VFDLVKLFKDVFHPESGERVVIIRDEPHSTIPDNPLWADRRVMAEEWRETLNAHATGLDIEVAPLVTFPAVGAHNGDLPLDKGSPSLLREVLEGATIGLALTEFSPTASMVAWAKEHDDFRCATLPQVARRMEETALAADYVEVARRCLILKGVLDGADSAEVHFSTGHKWYVDLRENAALMDDGQLPRGRAGGSVINLPSGESFQVPLEGNGSLTQGEIPVREGDEDVVYVVEENRIVDVRGGPAAGRTRSYFGEDPARGNIAEFAFGCNPLAVVWDNVLEDEKAGFHWAFGRSEHLGGEIGPDAFLSPKTIVHQDIVYARESPIQVTSVVLSGQGRQTEVIASGDYVVF
jgi:hypothetical protein